MQWMRSIFAVFALVTSPAFAGNGSEITVSLMFHNVAQRNSFEDLMRAYQHETSDSVTLWVRDDAGYKAAIEGWLTSEYPPHVLYWQAGQRLAGLVEQGHVVELDRLWAEESWDDAFPPKLRKAVSVGASVYALPYTYYPWAFFYRQSLFKRHGWTVPSTVTQLLALCKAQRDKGLVPIVVGTKEHWPAAAWFDFLNLRINGLDFRQQFVTGRIPYTDPRIRSVFSMWKQLLDSRCFISNPEQYTWSQVLPEIYNDSAAIILTGSFVIPELPERLVDDFGIFPFPAVVPEYAGLELAPVDVFLVPRSAKNDPSVKRLMSYLARPQVQRALNTQLGAIPAHRKASSSSDRLTQEAAAILTRATGIAQYFDRDVSPAMDKVITPLLAAFFTTPDVDVTIRELERARLRVISEERDSALFPKK